MRKNDDNIVQWLVRPTSINPLEEDKIHSYTLQNTEFIFGPKFSSNSLADISVALQKDSLVYLDISRPSDYDSTSLGFLCPESNSTEKRDCYDFRNYFENLKNLIRIRLVEYQKTIYLLEYHQLPSQRENQVLFYVVQKTLFEENQYYQHHIWNAVYISKQKDISFIQKQIPVSYNLRVMMTDCKDDISKNKMLKFHEDAYYSTPEAELCREKVKTNGTFNLAINTTPQDVYFLKNIPVKYVGGSFIAKFYANLNSFENNSKSGYYKLNIYEKTFINNWDYIKIGQDERFNLEITGVPGSKVKISYLNPTGIATSTFSNFTKIAITQDKLGIEIREYADQSSINSLWKTLLLELEFYGFTNSTIVNDFPNFYKITGQSIYISKVIQCE